MTTCRASLLHVTGGVEEDHLSELVAVPATSEKELAQVVAWVVEDP